MSELSPSASTPAALGGGAGGEATKCEAVGVVATEYEPVTLLGRLQGPSTLLQEGPAAGYGEATVAG